MEEITDESIEILRDIANNPWFKEEDVKKYIGMLGIVEQTKQLSFRNKRTRADLTVKKSSPCWPENNHDIFLSVNGLLSVTTNSRKPRARHVTAWLVRDVVPRKYNSLVVKLDDKVFKLESKIGYQAKKLTAIEKELTNAKREVGSLRLQAFATNLRRGGNRAKEVGREWNSLIDNSEIIQSAANKEGNIEGLRLILKEDWDQDLSDLRLKEDEDEDRHECCPANLIKAAAIEEV